jgi:hypothetical protein
MRLLREGILHLSHIHIKSSLAQKCILCKYTRVHWNGKKILFKSERKSEATQDFFSLKFSNINSTFTQTQTKERKKKIRKKRVEKIDLGI